MGALRGYPIRPCLSLIFNTVAFPSEMVALPLQTEPPKVLLLTVLILEYLAIVIDMDTFHSFIHSFIVEEPLRIGDCSLKFVEMQIDGMLALLKTMGAYYLDLARNSDDLAKIISICNRCF
jgi:hypothetical protein